MKTSEFQFNDWVKYGCGDPQFCAHQIKGLKENIIYFDDYTATSWFSAENAYPIPITKELLEKNGFKENKGGYYVYRTDDEKDSVSYYFSCEPNSSIYVTKDEYSEQEATFDVPRPYFIHELQHILRMFGLNELADNFQI